MGQKLANLILTLPSTTNLDPLRKLKEEEMLIFSNEEATGQNTTCPPDWFHPEECGLPIFPEDIDDRSLLGLEDIIKTDLKPEDVLELISDPQERASAAEMLAYQTYMLKRKQPSEQIALVCEFTLCKLFPKELRPICLTDFTFVYAHNDSLFIETKPDELLRGFKLDDEVPKFIICEVSLPS